MVEIDLQNQSVLLEDGEVSLLGARPTLPWLHEAPRAPRRPVGGDPGGLKDGQSLMVPRGACRLAHSP